jgi:hypothetical protein
MNTEFIRSDFKKKMNEIFKQENIYLIDEWFEAYDVNDRVIMNWKSEELKKTMRIQEADSGETIQFAGYIDKCGLNYEFDDIFIQAINVNTKVNEIFNIYKLWFINNEKAEVLQKILDEYSDYFNKMDD